VFRGVWTATLPWFVLPNSCRRQQRKPTSNDSQYAVAVNSVRAHLKTARFPSPTLNSSRIPRLAPDSFPSARKCESKGLLISNNQAFTSIPLAITYTCSSCSRSIKQLNRGEVQLSCSALHQWLTGIGVSGQGSSSGSTPTLRKTGS